MKEVVNKPYFLPMMVMLLVCFGVVGFQVTYSSEVPGLIYMSLKPLCLIVLFVFMYLFFCWLFISLFNFNEVQWKKVDYAWLALASLALISESQHVRTDWYKSDRIVAVSSGNMIRAGVRSDIDDMVGPAKCAPFPATNRPVESMGELERACVHFSKILTRKNDELTDLALYIFSENIPDAKRELSGRVWQDWLNRLEVSYKALWESQDEARNIGLLLKETPVERAYRWFLPVLLVFALALRAAKVNGEILLKSPRKELWLILNRGLELQGAESMDKLRIVRCLDLWRQARRPVVHVKCHLNSFSEKYGSSIYVKPGFFENEFAIADFCDFEGSRFAKWVDTQPVDTIYVLGEGEGPFLVNLMHWGARSKVKILPRCPV
jgi:hypothetical protein